MVLFPDHKKLIMGESLDALISNTMFGIGMVIVLVEGLRHLLGMPRQPNTRTLKMRKVKNLSGEFLAGGITTKNPFLREDALRAFVFADKIDYSVMKLLQADVPLLAEQEHQHAKFHHMATKVVPETKFISLRWVETVMDYIFLRTPKWMMAGFCFIVESLSPLTGWLPTVLPWSKPMLSNLIVFHMFEEIEHATVTVHYLRELCPFYVRLACMLLFGLLMQVALVVPLTMPFYAAYTNPKILFKPRTYLIDLPMFYLHLCVTEYAVAPWMVIHFLFAIPHYDFVIDYFYQSLGELMKERGFECEIIKEKTYVLDKSLHAEAPKHNKYLDPLFYLDLAKPYAKAAYTFAEDKVAFVTKVLDVDVQDLIQNGLSEKNMTWKPAGGNDGRTVDVSKSL